MDKMEQCIQQLQNVSYHDYTFPPVLGDLDLHLFGEGKHWRIYRKMGAHCMSINAIEGVYFCVWAPSAKRVSVIGSFNNWNGLRHLMRALGNSGVWEIFIPEVQAGDAYKYEILTQKDQCLIKTDPYAMSMEFRPSSNSIVSTSGYLWKDEHWLRALKQFQWQHEPINIYEVHLGSWQRESDGRFLNYKVLAHKLVEYLRWMGYTHVELLPIMEHPLDESWGYQVSGYYAPTSRFGTPDDFRYFVDYCHQNNIGVFLDWVPAHFPKDIFALGRFDGTALYEHADPRQGEHQDWGTYIFNYNRNEVPNFLIANALYWIDEFHIDGLRVDAVASMLYLNYSRKEGQWIPNEFGGHENLEAIEFLKTLNIEVHSQHPGVVMMAEESTSWPMVSKPTSMGGIGFSMKWNMGWMNDTLKYFHYDPIYRQFHHNELTFSQTYAYSENFILPLSHDEVVHLKHALINKMPGDDWQKMANLRLLFGYQQLTPGKKLLFMGAEFAQWNEWSENKALDWYLCEHPSHRGIMRLVRDLNHLYRQEKALHQYDFEQRGFRWIDCNDHSQSILSFIRQTENAQLVCVFNFTPVKRSSYRIGLPQSGLYKELLNSDSTYYGGSNIGCFGQVHSVNIPCMSCQDSVEIVIPPLAFIVLKKMAE
ncbi:1,4-alpha-glucan branching protein GlgB [Caedibacter taeniospiralis]|jgi:1,4-alpha-glucan branching enzyme|uniref:1,4-alpha-glucan branching protein GlgB n=1 Tax=Caedibacter taeniospiralis TaxID=28907 RepID=UPI0037BF0B05